MGAEIPVWIGGLQKWVTGITKRTTCDDVVRAVLASSNDHRDQKTAEKDSRNYTLVERWKKGERHLEGRSRILKLWKTWSEEQCNVRITLKKIATTSSSSSSSSPSSTPTSGTPTSSSSTSATTDSKHHRGVSKSGSCSRSRRRCTKSSSSSSSSPCRYRTIHPKKLHPKSESPEDPESIDLVRTVICQNETLDKQMSLLNKKDDEIDYYETMIHMMRMEEVGVNYLLDTYLNESEELAASCASAKAKRTEENLGGIQTAIVLYEKVLDVCRRIVNEEECIRDLSTQIRDHVTISEGNDRLTTEINKTKAEIKHLVSVNESQRETLDQNCRTIIECDRILAEKHQCLINLQEEMDFVDQENVLLEQELYRLQWSESSGESSAESSPVRGQTDSFEGADSNSDTGISSLHSSSDDGGYVLDTLV